MRLIDADKLKEDIKENGCDRFETWDKMLTLAEYETFVGDVIDNAPTVIKDNRPAICFNCEHCCALTVNSDGVVKVMCNLGAENCDNQRPQGEWKITDAYPHKVYCDRCFKTYAQENWEVWKDGSLPRNFCPNCGAEMRKGEI